MVDGAAAGNAARLGWVYFVTESGLGNDFVGDGNFQKDLPVTLLNMYDAQTMDFMVSWLFLDHEIMNCCPTWKDVVL